MSNILDISPLGFPWETQDPFLFCAYHKDDYPSGTAAMGVDLREKTGRNIGQDFKLRNGWRMYHGSDIPGFPYHPHRGFETITINKEGVVDHTDSLGAAGRFKGGDVQWMTAGRGVQHSEMFPLINEDKGNPLEIFQIWLNLPAASKMVEPHFKMLWREDLPTVSHRDQANRLTSIDVVAGQIGNTKALVPAPDSWAANPDNAVAVYTVKLEALATWTLSKTKSECSRSVYYHKGASLMIENTQVSVGHRVRLNPGEDILFGNGPEDSYLLILEGRPIGESVVQHGPFVMNTHEEIRDTMKEYGKTQFGGWPWGEREFVHPRERGRFALHADGTEELKED